jgi:uncharacterized protein YgiM (DUF1202 family)
MSNRNRNYTNYSKPNKPAETNPDENVQNLQENLENTEPATNTAPESKPEPEAPKAVTGVVVNCELLNIRAEAKADAKIVGKFFKGQEIEIYLDTSTEDFYDVNVGFCMKQYIEINK